MEIYSIIPARSNSKGIPSKNIKPLNGFPLLAYSIAASKLTKVISRTIVSTNSPEIAEMAKKYGAEAPFLRPAKYCKDSSNDLDAIGHALKWLEKNESSIPDLIVYLRPTTPLREPAVLAKAISELRHSPGATSLRSGHAVAEPPHKMFQILKTGFFGGFFPNFPRPEYHGIPRQFFPQTYHPNGYVDIVRSNFIKRNNFKRCFGEKIKLFVTPFVIEIDHPEDFEYLEYRSKKIPGPLYNYLVKNFFKKMISL